MFSYVQVIQYFFFLFCLTLKKLSYLYINIKIICKDTRPINMKLKSIYKNIILESASLTDFDGYTTHAALTKEKEIKGKDIKPDDAIDDLDLNTLNRNLTIKEYGYGPLNPDDIETSQEFWEKKSELWNTTIEHAKTARCSNCAAFDRSKQTLDKIAKALGDEGITIVEKAELGFCELFWFKCAGARTCDAWLRGGPIQ